MLRISVGAALAAVLIASSALAETVSGSVPAGNALYEQGKYEEAVEMRSEMTAMRIHELEAENNIGLGLEGLD